MLSHPASAAWQPPRSPAVQPNTLLREPFRSGMVTVPRAEVLAWPRTVGDVSGRVRRLIAGATRQWLTLKPDFELPYLVVELPCTFRAVEFWCAASPADC